MAEEKELELDAKEIDLESEEEGQQDAATTPSSKAEQKVELDLDDAPFLEEEEEKEEQEEEKKEEVKEEKKEEVKEEEAPEPKKKKKIIFLIAGAVILILIAVSVYFLFFKKEKKKEIKEQKPPEKKIEVKEKPPPPKPKLIQLTLRPFWVDYPLEKGHAYLHLTLVLSYEKGQMTWELIRKRIVIRDAIYYYLKNKKFNFFLNKKNIPLLKKDIKSIINQYLVYGKIKKIYFKDYLIE